MSEDMGALALRLAVFDLMKDRVAAGVADAKASAEQSMTVGDRKVVVVPTEAGPAKVATVTYVEGRAGKVEARVTNLAEFAEWALQDNPTAVHMEPRVQDWFTAEALKRASQGEVIPGIEVDETEPGRPYVRVQRDKSPDAQAALMGFLFGPEAIANFRSLLALEPPASSE